MYHLIHTGEYQTITTLHIHNHLFFLISVALRSELSLQPTTEETAEDDGKQFDVSEGFSYEDFFNHNPATRLQQKCCRRGDESGIMMIINMVPVKDTVTCKETGDIRENCDIPFVLHLWPSVLLRNLLPYPIAYKLKVGCTNIFSQLSLTLLDRRDFCQTCRIKSSYGFVIWYCFGFLSLM